MKNGEIVLKIKIPKTRTIVLIIIILIFCSFVPVFFAKLSWPEYASVQIQIADIQRRLTLYKSRCGVYPTTKEGLVVFADQSKSKCSNFPKGSIMEDGKVPMSFFDEPFKYISDGSKYMISSSHDDLLVIAFDNDVPRVYETKKRE